jgi:hypothetical protein
MKTKILYWLGFLFLAFTFASCSDDEVGSSDTLVGYWQLYSEVGWEKEDGEKVDEWDDVVYDEDDFEYVYFYEDGTGKSGYYYNGRRYEEESFTWSIKGKQLIGYDEEDEGHDDKVTIKTLTRTTLVVELNCRYEDDGIVYEEHNVQTYHRASEE